MLEIPYVKMRHRKWCALSCYTMVAQHFFPETTEEEPISLTHADPEHVAWAFPFWKWMLDKGIKITDYDLLGYKKWFERGRKA